MQGFVETLTCGLSENAQIVRLERKALRWLKLSFDGVSNCGGFSSLCPSSGSLDTPFVKHQSSYKHKESITYFE